MKNKFSQLLLYVSKSILWGTILLFANVVSAHTIKQVSPEITVETDSNMYIVYFHLSDYCIKEEEESCGVFSHIEMTNFSDVTDIPGYPELPFFPLNLLLPDSVSYYTVNMISSKYTDIELKHPIQPAEYGSVINYEDSVERELSLISGPSPCDINTYYYTNGNDSLYPTGFYNDSYTHQGIYQFLQSNGVTLSIFPFAYDPVHDSIHVLTDAIFEIEFDGGDVENTVQLISKLGDHNSLTTLQYYDNIVIDKIIEGNIEQSPATYLIVAAREAMKDSLYRYITYKENQMYNVSTIYLDQELATGDAVKIAQLIRRYRPDYVLLVGSFEDIPASIGSRSKSNPYSDDNYHTHIGRWVLSERWVDDLIRIIDKTLNADSLHYNSTQSSAVLFSENGSTSRQGRVFYEGISTFVQNSFAPLYLPHSVYDGRNGYDFYTLRSALKDDPTFFVYHGKGLVASMNHRQIVLTTGLASPYNLIPDGGYVNQNTTTYKNFGEMDLFPLHTMGFGFANSLNSFGTHLSFGARWVTSNNCGVTFYGSSTESHRSANISLSKHVATRLKQMSQWYYNNYAITDWLYLAEQSYKNALSDTKLTRKHQVARYNLMGDPTMYIFGMDSAGNAANFHKPAIHDDAETDVANSEVIRYQINSISGLLLSTAHDEIQLRQSIESLKSGIYTVSAILANGKISTQKIVINK